MEMLLVAVTRVYTSALRGLLAHNWIVLLVMAGSAP